MNAALQDAMTNRSAGVDIASSIEWSSWAWFIGRITVAIVVGLVLHTLVFTVVRRMTARTSAMIDERTIRPLRRPLRLIFPLIVLMAMTPFIAMLSTKQIIVLRHVIGIGAIVGVTWLIVTIIGIVEQEVRRRHDVTIADNLEARRIHTQVAVMSRTLMTFVIVLGMAAALMTIPRVREIGASLLVSAGFAGLVIGLAARPVLENLIAGVQIAFTQPIRLDDVVIIDGEWGRIEEITTTYVVVRIWDQRRLIVPFSKFMSESFQNWTRTSADLLGTVFMHADYRVDVGVMRAALRRIVEGTSEWDERVCELQVTDAGEHTVQLRALVSARDSGRAWDLRVHVRERLLEFMQREHPAWLPRTRIDLEHRDGSRTVDTT